MNIKAPKVDTPVLGKNPRQFATYWQYWLADLWREMAAIWKAILAINTAECCEPLTNGDPINPELIFADGDCVMVKPGS
jgi:hypothetical protein